MSDDGSDIEIKSALPKKKVKIPKSPSEGILKNPNETKKPSTKEMITEALIELKSRKGVSLYAIKKYLTEKHKVDTDKINYIIKKNIKTGVETGTIVQMKGVGASGSFKLAAVKKAEKKATKKPEQKEKSKTTKKTMEKPTKPKSTEEKTKKPKPVKAAKKTENQETKKVDKEKIVKKKEKDKNPEEKKEKVTKNKMAKVVQTPAKKKAAMMKRKSIGSIIKPPKMKPKAKA